MKAEVNGVTSSVAFPETRPRRSVVLHGAIVAGLAVGVGMVAFWGTRAMVCGKVTGLPSYALGKVDHLKTELGLDDRQVAAIRALEHDLAEQLSEQCGRYCAVRAELGQTLMEEGTNSAVEARRLVDGMCAIQSASERATLEHIRKVNALLTPGQRRQFLAGLTRCLCGGEGLCAGGCKGGGEP